MASKSKMKVSEGREIINESVERLQITNQSVEWLQSFKMGVPDGSTSITIPTESDVIASEIIVKRPSEPDATRNNLVASASQVAVSSVEE